MRRLNGWNARRYLERSVADPALRRALTPDYAVGCKRVVINDRFYAAMQQANVSLVTAPIARVEARGVVTADADGQETLQPLDVLVLATGFAPYRVDMDIVGKDGRHLSELMSGSPLMYRTIGVPGFPNYFVLFGPYSPIGNMSIIENSEIQVDYILQCVDLIRRGAVKSMDPREDVSRALKEDMRRQVKHTVWASGCASWYLDANGDAVAYPYAYPRYRAELRAPVLAEFEVAR